MKNTRIVLAAIAAFAVIGMTAPASWAGPATRPKPMKEKAEKGQPFKGKVEAVDTQAKTLTVGGTALLVSDTTRLTKDGKAITLADIKVGDYVHGHSHTLLTGKTEALSVVVGKEHEGK
jgi:hypothetical protein